MSYLCLRKQRKILNKRAMAIIDENIRGKVGNSVFYRVGSITRVRSAAANYLDANTIKQQENRSRLRVAIRFYQRLVEIGLQEAWYLATQGTGKNGYNFFLKLNMMVFKPNGKIGDFARLQLTVGMLQKVNHLMACVDEEDAVVLSWEKAENLPSAGMEDELVVVVLYADRSFSPVLFLPEEERGSLFSEPIPWDFVILDLRLGD